MKNIIFITLLSYICVAPLWAAKTSTVSPDSLNAYYQKYLEDPTDPIVLTAADTLFAMAKSSQDLVMMKQALSAKIDFYFYGDGEHYIDSVKVWTERIQQHAKVTQDIELYFWVWSARLIYFYLKKGEYNMALVEAEKMLAEAEKSKRRESVAECYSALANIYNAKGLKNKSQEFMLKEIDLVEKNNLNRFDVTFQYSDAASIYIANGEADKAKDLLKKAAETAITPYHKVTAKLAQASYYLAKNNITAAKETLEECMEIYDTEIKTRRHIHYYYEIQVEYFRKIKDYTRALEALELRKQELEKRKDKSTLMELNKTRADLLWEAGRKEEAADYYKIYLESQIKTIEKNEEVSTGEFATLLNMQRLTTEKQELEESARQKQLSNVKLIISLLTILVLALAYFFFHQRKLNQKLKRSRNELDKKNQILTQAEAEVRKAKELAEASSRMKTVFIQNMSHEIRTPLNSIVGFSAVLADQFATQGGDEELTQYSELIETNSHLLLDLINDILDISDLDNDTAIPMRPTDVNECCQIVLTDIKPLAKDGINIVFEPGAEALTIESNPDRIVQVLRKLMNNAIKFTDSGNVTLAYEIQKNKNLLVFSVADTGPGIPAGKEDHIFERFVKLDDFSQGAGLGLPICKIIAEKMGGHLVVDKEYKGGARFIFSVEIR